MTDGLDILVKWPTRARPYIFKQTFERWQNHRVRFVVTLDDDDAASADQGFRQWLASQSNVRVAVGKHTGKIDAINADLDGEDFDILILGQDDAVPQSLDYDQKIAHLFRDHIPDFDGLLFLPDGRRHDDLITITIMGEPYYRRFNYLYHPDYISLWADNEQGDVARSLNRCIRINETIIKHDWIGDHSADALHHRNESYFRRDRDVYLKRKAKGFPLASVLA